MGWSFPVGRVLGISVRLHVTFVLLLGFIGYGGFIQAGPSGAIWSLAWLCSIFACIVLHELGHSVVAQQLDVQVKSITLLPIGGVAALRRIPENPWHEIAITLAGPMVNAAIAAVLLPIAGLPVPILPHGFPVGVPELLRMLVGVNVVLFAFNFVPAFPMDGGRLLRALLALALPYQRATVIAATVGQGLAIVFVVAGLLMPQVFLLIIGVFIFLGAEGEERMVRMRGLLRDIEVEEVMSREFAVLAPAEPVARGLELIYQTGQDDFPVVEAGRFVGMVTRRAMVEAINAGADPRLPVGELVDAGVPTVSPRAKVSRVYEELLSGGETSLPVLEQGRLVGLLAPENITRYVLVQASIKRRRRGKAPRRAGGAHVGAPPPVIAAVPPVAAPAPREESCPPTGPVSAPSPADRDR
jgi:Zn-dependent protease/CBS domain-containing protein